MCPCPFSSHLITPCNASLYQEAVLFFFCKVLIKGSMRFGPRDSHLVTSSVQPMLVSDPEISEPSKSLTLTIMAVRVIRGLRQDARIFSIR